MIKVEDPHTVDNYVLSNNLGRVSDVTYCRWARLFSKSLKLTLRRLRRNSFEGSESTIYTPVPAKRRRSRQYVQGNKDTYGSPTKTPDRTKRVFKFGFEIPKNWSDILIIDEAVGIPYGRMALKKKLLHWFITSALLLSLLISNHPNNINIVGYIWSMIWNLISHAQSETYMWWFQNWPPRAVNQGHNSQRMFSPPTGFDCWLPKHKRLPGWYWKYLYPGTRQREIFHQV